MNTYRIPVLAWCIAFGSASFAALAADSAEQTLQRALFEEEANQNLPAAIEGYTTVLRDFDQQRRLAATALFRLAECQRKLGATNNATPHYQRILAEFADQTNLVALSTEQLRRFGQLRTVPSNPAASGASTPEEAEELLRVKALVANSPDLINAPGTLTPLHVAAAKSHMSVATFLLNHNADVNIWGPSGIRPLHESVNNGHMKITELLIDRGADVNVLESHDGNSPLHLAVVKGYLNLIGLLLDNGADVSLKNQIGETPLHRAVLGQIPTAARWLLERGAPVDGQTRKANETPLHLAVFRRNADLVEALLERGANPNLEGAQQRTALHYALHWDASRDIVLNLIDHNADLKAEDENGQSPLITAILERPNVVELLLEKGANPNQRWIYPPEPSRRTPVRPVRGAGPPFLPPSAQSQLGQLNFPIHKAVSTTNVNAILALARHGADLDVFDYEDRTPLYISVMYYTPEITEALLRSAAQPDARPPRDPEMQQPSDAVGPQHGLTPLHVAVQKSDSLDHVRLLLDHGADVNLPAYDGKTALHFAVKASNTEAVELLLEKKADPNVRDHVGRFPLLAAILRRDDSITKRLVEAGADPSAEVTWPPNTVRRETAEVAGPILAVAARTGSTNAVQALLNAGAEVNTRDEQDESPLIIAAKNVDLAMVSLLLEHKADPNQKVNGYRSLLDMVGKIRSMQMTPTAITGRSRGPQSMLEDARITAPQVLKLLLEHGAKPDAPPNEPGKP